MISFFRAQFLNAGPKPFSRGFTLIEMSIVLVVIGLIIGGILKGQELINSSRSKSLISDVNNIRAGMLTFVDRYNNWPGDYANATSRINASLRDGNGNGEVSRFNGNQATRVARNAWRHGSAINNGNFQENHQVWLHLTYSDILPIASSDLSTLTDETFPSGPHPSARFEFSHAEGRLHQGPNDLPYGAYLRYSTFDSDRTPEGVLKSVDAHRIDAKYDDGIPFNSVNNNTDGYSATIFAMSGRTSSDQQDCVSNQEVYQILNNNEKACVMFFKVGP